MQKPRLPTSPIEKSSKIPNILLTPKSVNKPATNPRPHATQQRPKQHAMRHRTLHETHTAMMSPISVQRKCSGRLPLLSSTKTTSNHSIKRVTNSPSCLSQDSVVSGSLLLTTASGLLRIGLY
jgi:hypothetical protein